MLWINWSGFILFVAFCYMQFNIVGLILFPYRIYRFFKRLCLPKRQEYERYEGSEKMTNFTVNHPFLTYSIAMLLSILLIPVYILFFPIFAKETDLCPFLIVKKLTRYTLCELVLVIIFWPFLLWIILFFWYL